MSKPKISFAWLRQFLLDLHFSEVVVPKSHVRFYHQDTGTDIILPVYRSNQMVMPHHLVSVRFMLDAKGVMNGDHFDELVSAASAKQAAS